MALRLPIAGLLNNAGIMQMRPTRNALGWDMSFVTNHLGPFALTEALVPRLPDGANVVFVVSAVEDPERKPAVAAGFRGGRYISAEASARGEWKPGGSNGRASTPTQLPNKPSLLRRWRLPVRLHGCTSTRSSRALIQTPVSGQATLSVFLRFLQRFVIPLLVPLFMPFIKILSTPKRAARVITKILIDTSGQTGIYYDEGGHPMQGSALVRDPKFQDRVVAETRALLATVPA